MMKMKLNGGANAESALVGMARYDERVTDSVLETGLGRESV